VAGPLADWALMNLVASPSGLVWRVDREALRRLNEDASGRDLWSEAERLAADLRLTCIRGQRSHFVSNADAERLAKLGAEVRTLEGASHFLHVDQPQALLEMLEEVVRAE